MAETNTILSSNSPPIKNNFFKKDTCAAVFIEALFTIAKMWKQSKGPSTDKEDVVHACNGISLSHEKNETMPFAATWVENTK